MTLVANARMYAVRPAVKAAWQELFAWVATTSGVPLSCVDHAEPLPIDALWLRDDLGAAFMCGYPYGFVTPKRAALAAPVPSPPRYGGRPCYCTDLIVRSDSRFATLPDAAGGRIGWTLGHSQSGYNAVRHHLVGRPVQFSKWIGPLATPRRVIDAVLKDEIDVGPLDSYVHDLIKRHDPDTAAKLHTVESTAMTPIPLLVASPGIGADEIARLRGALLSCHGEPALAGTRDTLLLARFAEVDPADYQVLLTQRAKADDANMPNPSLLA